MEIKGGAWSLVKAEGRQGRGGEWQWWQTIVQGRSLSRSTTTATVGRGPMWSLVTTEQTGRLQVASELPLAECFLS